MKHRNDLRPKLQKLTICCSSKKKHFGHVPSKDMQIADMTFVLKTHECIMKIKYKTDHISKTKHCTK